MGPRRPLELSGGPAGVVFHAEFSRGNERGRHLYILGQNGHVKFECFYMAFWAPNVKLTDPLVAAIEFGASSYPRKIPSKAETKNSEKIMKCVNDDMLFWSLNRPFRAF